MITEEGGSPFMASQAKALVRCCPSHQTCRTRKGCNGNGTKQRRGHPGFAAIPSYDQ